jgi:hypothetical protein
MLAKALCHMSAVTKKDTCALTPMGANLCKVLLGHARIM